MKHKHVLIGSLLLLLLAVGCKKKVYEKRGAWAYYTSANNLINNNILCIESTPEGVWIGTEFGTSFFNGQTFRNFNMQQGLIHHQVNAVAYDKTYGAIWFATPFGASKFYNNAWTSYTDQNVLNYNYVNDVATDLSGNPWIGTGRGVAYFDQQNNDWIFYLKEGGSSLVHNIVRAVVVDNNNAKWFGTEYGISKFQNNQWKTFLSNLSLDDFILCLYVDSKNRIWAGTLDGVSMIENDVRTDYKVQDGLVYGRVDAIAEDAEGVMWFGTQNGASAFDGSIWKTYNTINGLKENWITALAVDKDGRIWFGTKTRGLCVLEK